MDASKAFLQVASDSSGLDNETKMALLYLAKVSAGNANMADHMMRQCSAPLVGKVQVAAAAKQGPKETDLRLRKGRVLSPNYHSRVHGLKLVAKAASPVSSITINDLLVMEDKLSELGKN